MPLNDKALTVKESAGLTPVGTASLHLRTFLTVLLTTTALVGAAPAWADSIVWRGTFDNSYSQATNWENVTSIGSDRVPTGNDTAFVTDSTAIIQPTLFNGFSASVRTVTVGSNSGPVTLTVNGALGLGDPGAAGTLNIATGSGIPANAVGTVIISGSAASIGAAADANGGANPGLNIATVSGGNGTLRVENGGAGTFASLCLACGGAGFNGVGLIEVTGAGSTLDITSTAAVIRIGENSGSGGTGTLSVQNGGAVTMAGGVGDVLGVGSSIVVQGVDGTGNASQLTWNGLLTSNGSVTVSNGARTEIGVLNLNDTAELTVSSGARLNQISGESGNWTFGQQAVVQISGTGTELNVNGALSISSSNIGAGSADFVISNGAVVNVNSSSQSGLAFGEERFLFVNDSTLNMTGGLLMNRGNLSATNATLNFGGGNLDMGSAFDGNTLSLINTNITAAQISTNATGAGVGNVINLGGTAGGPAGNVGAFNVGMLSLNGSGGGSELVINHTATDFDIASAISSTGTIRHIAGDTIFSGASGSFGGQTLVTGGTLSVNGSLGNTSHSINVSNGAVIGGSGTIGGAALIADATLAPGNSPGTLTFSGNLALSSSSALNFELGNPAGTAGVNSDLINVAGNLVLDGTLNVSDAGGFGAGLYRLINYGGALTDNGLDIGTAPGGFNSTNLTVQTATANQVNLLVGAPLINSFFMWDGANTSANNVVNGGTGVWTATGTNWTTANGSTNGVFDTSQLLIFAGTGGTVTVDDGTGAINVAAGMQFATDGYVLSGDDINIGTNDIVLRVGDGTAAGANFVTELRNNITGSGDIEFTDLGTLILSGTSSGTGNFEVNNGRALINGTATNSQTFVLGGTLGGTGTIMGSTFVNSGGTVAPGNSIGTLTVGNITFNAGSTYEVELNDGGNVAGSNNDLINATGTATINGGTIHVTPVNGTDDGSSYTPGTVYTVLNTAGGRTGQFSAVSDDYAFLNFTDSYDANNVYLTSALASPTNPCGALSLTFNQDATCGGVVSIGSGGLYTAVLNLSNAEAPVALDQLSGEAHASAKMALADDSRFAREAAMNRLRVALGGSAAAPGQATKGTPEGTTIWAEGIGGWSQWLGDGNAATFKRGIGGLFMGADAEIAENITLGLMGGYSHSGFNISDRMSSGTVNSYYLGAYAGGAWDAFSLKGGAAYSWNHFDISRQVSFTGFADSLSSSYNAHAFQAFTEAAYTIETGNAQFEPFANIAYVNLSSDGYTEQGGAAALSAAGQVVNATFTTLGMRGETEFEFGESNAILSGGIGWRHVFGNTPTATHNFAGGSAFTVAGVPLARDMLVIDAGLAVELTDNATLGVTYNGLFAAGLTDHAAKASLDIQF